MVSRIAPSEMTFLWTCWGGDAVDENRAKTDGAENETRDAPDFNDQSDIENRNAQHGIQP